MVTNREMTGAGYVDFSPTIWAEDTRDAITFKEVLPKLCNTQYESQMSIGRTLQIPLRGNLDTQTKTEGYSNTISFQAISENAGSHVNNYQQVVVSTYEYAAQLLNVVIDKQSKYNERQRITKQIGYALMRGVEVTIATLFSSFSQIVGTLGSDPDLAVLQRAWQYLADQDVDDESAAWVFSPAPIAGFFGNDKLTSRDFVPGANAITTAKIGNLLGHPVYRSNLLVAPAAGQTNCAFFHNEAIILIRQIKPTMKNQYLIEHNADGVIGFDLYTAAEAKWVSETPLGDNTPGGASQVGDYGAVLIRTS